VGATRHAGGGRSGRPAAVREAFDATARELARQISIHNPQKPTAATLEITG
jgi:hypothetical protein